MTEEPTTPCGECRELIDAWPSKRRRRMMVRAGRLFLLSVGAGGLVLFGAALHAFAAG